MKKTLFALALAGVFAGTAQAQSHVTVYGIVDTGIAKQTGKDTYMTHNYESSLGFRGTEYSATATRRCSSWNIA